MIESIRVLHVDDDPDFADLTATFLEREDDRLEIETVTSADAGTSRLAQERFDCIVSDYDMPGKNGIDFLEAVREENPDIPFILYTGKGSETVASDAISAGVTDYLQKGSGSDQYTILANRITNAVTARRAEADADQTRQRLRQILKTVPACIVRLNREGEFIFANERAMEVLGLERSDVTERTYNDPEWKIRDLDGEPIPDEKLPFRKVRDSGEPLYGVRHTIEWPDGTRKILLVNGTPLFDDDGNVEYVVFALSDITDHVEHETRLKRTTARLQALFENSPDMINVHDGDGTITDCNARLCEETGYDQDQLVGMKVWDLDQAIDPDEARRLWAEMDIGERRELEGCYQRQDGSTFPASVHVRRLDSEAEDRFVVISRDISEQKAREQTLQERTEEFEELTGQLETQYRHLFEEAPVMAVLTRAVDGEPVIEECNQSFLDTLGYDRSDVTGRKLAEFYTPESTKALLNQGGYDRALAGEFVREDRTLMTADGESVETLLRAVPRQDAGDNVTGTLAMYIDIRERKELERETKRLEEFTSIVSHDLRNPLNVAQSRLELARDECDSDHLVDVASAHDRMETLIEDLLALARHGTQVSEMWPVEVAPLAEKCWGTVATSEATLETNIERRIQADQSRFQQLLENLIRNAVEHGGRDVTITVDALDDGFYIEDDGPGIPEENRDLVFDTGYSTAAQGTGFGLSIVKQVADAHGWDIHVTDGTDGGTRFEITGVEFAE